MSLIFGQGMIHNLVIQGVKPQWALWLSKTLSIPIEKESIQVICDLEDSVVALVALDLYQNSDNFQENLELKKWESIVDPSNTNKPLSSKSWLLCYESSIKGYFPKVNQNKYIEENEFFCALRQNGISFYNPKKQIDSLEKYLIKPYEFPDDNEENSSNNSSSWMRY